MTGLTGMVALVVIALGFGFLNGMHDSGSIVATVMSSRAMSPRRALALTALCELAGPFLFGVSVASTIGSKVVDPRSVTLSVTLAALLAAIIWNGITLLLGLPSSSSHALIGGIIGAAAWGHGFDVIRWDGLTTVLVALFAAPLLGLIGGFLVMKLMYVALRGASPRANVWMRRAQYLTTAGLAFSHGTNDAQKTMGIITMGLVSAGFLPSFEVPLWVVASAAAAMSLGTLAGGWKIIRTLGGKFFKIRPMHALTSQLTSAGIVLGASLLGGPVSTTQVVSSSIMGAGSGQRASQVRWGVARDILVAWLLTIPLAAVIAAMLYALISWLLG